MSLPQFKYYLRKKISVGVYDYYYVSGSSVLLTAAPTPLVFTPEGWQGKELAYKRGFEYWGVFTTMSAPLKFVKDGAKILKHIYFTNGVEGECELYIERLNDTLQTYAAYYRGEIDFSKILREADYVTANAMDGAYPELLKSREDTVYEVPIDTNNYFYIKMDGITLRNKIDWVTNEEYRVNNNGASIIGLTKFGAESQIGDYNFKTVDAVSGIASSLYQNKKNAHIINIDQSMFVTVSWDFFFTLYPLSNLNYTLSNFSIVLVHTNSAGTTLNTFLAYPSTSFYTINNIAQHCVGSTTFTLATGDKLHLVSNITGSFGYGIATSLGDYNISAEFRLKESYIKGIPPVDVFDNLVDEISDNTVSKSATPLTTLPLSKRAVTCGDAIRGLASPKIKTSFKDLFKSYDVQKSLATYYDKNTNTHKIVNKADVLNPAVTVYDCGEVSKLEVKPVEDLLYSSIKAGLKDYDYDELNGRDEFNCEFEFTTPITRVKKPLDMLSPYRTDMYGAEFLRANLTKKESTDNEADNDTFILDIKSTPSGIFNGVDYYELQRYGPITATITGLLFPYTAFNIDLSPKRSILNNGALLHSMLHLMDSKAIKFQTASKNDKLKTVISAVTTEEKADITIGDLPSPLFLPIFFEFDCVQPINVQQLLDADPYGKITFKWLGESFEGFLFESTESPATRASQRIKLLATPNNDLTKLI